MASLDGILFGVDVHPDYQAGISFATLKREGYVFAVTKATEGTSYIAPGWDAYVRQARDAGLIPGAYHYLRAGDGAAQCRLFLAELERVGGPEGLLIQLDVESDGRAREIGAWLDEWVRQGHGGHPVLIYSGAWWWRPNVGSYAPAHREMPRCLSWHSHYVPGADAFGSTLYEQVDESWWSPGYGGWDRATILQYSSRASAGGINANVDVNAYRGTVDQLKALTTGSGRTGEGSMDQAQERESARNAHNSDWGITALLEGRNPAVGFRQVDGSEFALPNELHRKLDEINAKLDAQSELVAAIAKLAGALTAVAEAITEAVRADQLPPT